MAEEKNTNIPQGTSNGGVTPPAQPEVKVPAAAPATPSAPVVNPVPGTKPEAGPKTPDAGIATQKSEKNVFTELFGEDKSVGSGPGMMDTVLKQKEAKQKGGFLSSKPKLQPVEKAKREKKSAAKTSSVGAMLLQFSLLFLVAVGAFFYTQNAASFKIFGVNPAQRVLLAEEQVNDIKADIIVERHLSSVLLLEEFGSLADEYLYTLDQSKSTFVSTNKRSQYTNRLEQLRPELADILDELQVNLKVEITDEIQDLAKKKIDEMMADLRANENNVDANTLIQDIQDLETTRRLLQSKPFKSSLLALDLKNLKDEDVSTIYTGYTEINQSINALITNVKDDRIIWSTVITELEGITKRIDPLFGTEFQANLDLRDVKLDKGSKTVSISGYAVTDDTKNFTLVSNYIDALEASDIFSQVQERSYSKSSSSAEYESNFRITMQLTLEQ